MLLFHVKVKDSVPIQKFLLFIGHNGVQDAAREASTGYHKPHFKCEDSS